MLTFLRSFSALILVPLLFWLLPVLSVSAATNCAIQTVIPQTECNALLDIYNSTGGASWSDSPTNGWNQNDQPCTWIGVTCAGGGIDKLELSSKNLSGSLPSSLVNLTKLTVIKLNNNSLTGTIPALPASLVDLSLFTNQFSGNIPALPSNLKNLDLTFNNLTGTIPTLPTGLTSLWVSSNMLSGSIPTLPAGLTSLRLANNAFTGILPSISGLTGLTTLEMSFNAITGAAAGEDALVTAKQPNWKTDQTVAPTNINTLMLSETSIQVNWTVVANAGTGNFQVHYATTPGGPYTKAATTTPDQMATNYIVTGLTPSTTYYFVVQTVTQPSLPQQQNTIYSELSQEVTATTAVATAAGYQSLPPLNSAIDFGTPLIGTFAQQTLTIQEVGNIALNISRLQITGVDAARFSLTPNADFSIADGGAAQVLTLQCLPTAITPLNAALQLTTNDPQHPLLSYPLICSGQFNNFSLTLNTTGQGSINGCGANCTQTQPQNSNITLTTTPAPGWQFSSWGGDCVNGQVVMTANKTCTANFTAVPLTYFTLTLNTTGQGGINGCGANCTQMQPQNSSITLTTTPAPGWQFSSWSGDCVNGQLLVTANKTCTANFTALPPSSQVVVAPAAPPAPPNNGTANSVMSNYNQTTTNLTVAPSGSVSGGIFVGTTTNNGLIANVNIAPDSSLMGGKISGFNVNQGIVSDITVSQYSEISGGSYAGTINNNGLLINPQLLPNAQIVGGKLEGVVQNQGVLQNVSFAPHTQVIGGKLTGTITGNPDSYVIIGEADLTEAQVANACLTVTARPPQNMTNSVIVHEASSSGLATQDFCIAPQTVANFTPEKVSVTEKLAFSSFTAQNVSELPPTALSALTPEQFANVPQTSLQGLNTLQYQSITIETFGGLQQKNMGGLNTQVIHEVDSAHLAALSPTEFQQMPSIGVAKWLTNVNTDNVSLEDIKPLLPVGWQMDSTGKLTAPADTQLAFKALALPKDVPSNLTLPSYQFDLKSGLAVGGWADNAETLLQKVNKSLRAQALDYQAEQTSYGVVMGKSPTEERQYAFLVNPENIVQRDHIDIVGSYLDAQGNYKIATTDAIEITLTPAPKDPAAMLTVLGRDSQIEIGQQGDVLLRLTQTNQRTRDGEDVYTVTMFDPFVEPGPSDICNEYGECDWSQAAADSQPGLYFYDNVRARQQAKLIYPDGTSQAIYPTVFAPETFMAGVKLLEGTESISFKSDGTFEMVYQGQLLRLYPSFTVQVTALEKYQQVQPSVQWKTRNVLQYQVQNGEQLLTTEVSF